MKKLSEFDLLMQVIKTMVLLPDGIRTAEIVSFFKNDLGFKFSEATFRKYIQSGLVSRCVRIGEKAEEITDDGKKKHRGSKGIYPSIVLLEILIAKLIIATNMTIDMLKKSPSFLVSRQVQDMIASAEEALRILSPNDPREKFFQNIIRTGGFPLIDLLFSYVEFTESEKAFIRKQKLSPTTKKNYPTAKKRRPSKALLSKRGR